MTLIDTPLGYAAVSFVAMWSAAHLGVYLRRRNVKAEPAERDELGVIVGATLTLLGLLIGFSFSMGVSRYDQRKNYEEEEANAIGTEYLRASLLPAADAAKVRALLESYLEQRILFYTIRDEQRLDQINATTMRLQSELWSAVRGPAIAQPTPVNTLVAAGMNDVLNSQGYTQAAWWNRIPRAAWTLMASISICCNILLGYNTRDPKAKAKRFFILPAIVAISFFLIADLDSARRGVIRVIPQNLLSLSDSLPAA